MHGNLLSALHPLNALPQQVSAWVHFSMYVGTGCREQRLVKQLKGQISKLASEAEAGPPTKPA